MARKSARTRLLEGRHGGATKKPATRPWWLWRYREDDEDAPEIFDPNTSEDDRDDHFDRVVDLTWPYMWSAPTGVSGDGWDYTGDDAERLDQAIGMGTPVVNYYPCGAMTRANANGVGGGGRDSRYWYSITPPITRFARELDGTSWWIQPEVFEKTGEVMRGDPRRSMWGLQPFTFDKANQLLTGQQALAALDSLLETGVPDPRYFEGL